AWLGPRLGAATRADLDTLRRREAAGGGGLAAAVLLVAAPCAAAGWFPPAGFDPGRFPVAMVQRLKAAEVRPRGPVLAPDFWGGDLILEWPGANGWVDGRWGLRGGGFFEPCRQLIPARPAGRGIPPGSRIAL